MKIFGSKIFIGSVLASSLGLFAAKAEEDWFAWTAKEIVAGSPVDASAWLGGPAGSRGPVRIEDDGFVFEDGSPVKFWGTNISFGWPYNPDRREVVEWADYLSRLGVNSIRWHKFSNSGTVGSATTIDPEKLANMDFFNGELSKRGIYYGWSHIFCLRPLVEDRDRLLYYDEIIQRGRPDRKHFTDGTTYAIASFFEDTQQLLIDHTVNLLNYRNTLTGKRNAEDPALVFIELHNEDNTFFGAADGAFESMPKYKAKLMGMFAEWLREKYGDAKRFQAAWKGEGLEEGESLDTGIYPKPNHGWFSYEFEKAQAAGTTPPQNVLDRAQFLYETQVNFYDRYARAIRETGYRGPIVGSCWQAGSGITHFYNLHSDSTIDGLPAVVDRHNYAKGDIPHVAGPEADLLSSGLQQVAHRPFQLSEWLVTEHTGYSADATVMIAAYGMGLQGWDGSYSYCQNTPFFTDALESPRHGKWNVDTPIHLGLYPALSRMVFRGDIEEGPLVAARKIHMPSLAKGKLGFSEKVVQDYDYKKIVGTMPAAAIGVGKVVVDFVDTFEETDSPDLDGYWDAEAQTIRSATGQLNWDYSGDGDSKGYFTIDSDGTKAVVGFASGTTHELGSVTIEPQSDYAVILLTSLDRMKGLDSAPSALLTTVARARNGEGHIAMEPVSLRLKVKGRDARLYPLGQDGSRSNKEIKESGGMFEIDGSEQQTIYYELRFEEG